MTHDITPDIEKIQLYLTEPHPCSYLEDRKATTAFVDPKFNVNGDIYNHLSLLGFRRSGEYVYTPRCSTCKLCIPVRIPAAKFKPSRQQRRSMKKNADLVVNSTTSVDLAEHYNVYQKYIDTRHRDGDMYPASLSQFQAFIGAAWECTRYLEFRLDGQLICCAVVDWLSSGLSAIYTYFDPDFAGRSLGIYAITKQIELTHHYDLDYVYLGYWIRDSDKMNYKSDFHPLQLYIDNRWLEIG
ncbi:MAG: arginyltransferase [Gammaproteobacteria bacterium]|nr:MAG: arginyltransferase [Gammaproteobacteria bacterium]RLA53230.1 MAG: arginyltransferase [Gammaproteobacteria bacterium]